MICYSLEGCRSYSMKMHLKSLCVVKIIRDAADIGRRLLLSIGLVLMTPGPFLKFLVLFLQWYKVCWVRLKLKVKN